MNVLFQQVVDIGAEVLKQGEFFNQYRNVGDLFHFLSHL